MENFQLSEAHANAREIRDLPVMCHGDQAISPAVSLISDSRVSSVTKDDRPSGSTKVHYNPGQPLHTFCGSMDAIC